MNKLVAIALADITGLVSLIDSLYCELFVGAMCEWLDDVTFAHFCRELVIEPPWFARYDVTCKCLDQLEMALIDRGLDWND